MLHRLQLRYFHRLLYQKLAQDREDVQKRPILTEIGVEIEQNEKNVQIWVLFDSSYEWPPSFKNVTGAKHSLKCIFGNVKLLELFFTDTWTTETGQVSTQTD